MNLFEYKKRHMNYRIKGNYPPKIAILLSNLIIKEN